MPEFNNQIPVNKIYPPEIPTGYIEMAVKKQTDQTKPYASFRLHPSDGNKAALDVFLFHNDYPGGYYRFFITEGYAWDEDTVKFFEQAYIYSFLWQYEEADCQAVIDEFSKQYPGLHLKEDYVSKPYLLISHLYYTLSGTSLYRELFFKAGLEYIAAEWDMIKEWKKETNPAAILGVPMKAMRALNSAFGTLQLDTEKKCVWMKALFQLYPYLFEKKWNDAQIYFATYLYKKGKTMGHREKTFFRRLEKVSVVYSSEPTKYLVSRDNLRGIIEFPEYPDIGEYLYDDTIRARYIEAVLLSSDIEKTDLVESAFIRVKKKNPRYCYENQDYCIRAIDSAKELFQLSVDFKNCAYGYVPKILRGETILLVVMQKGEELAQKAAAMVELSWENYLIQARKKYNRAITDEEKAFLNEYAAVKKFVVEDLDQIYDMDTETEAAIDNRIMEYHMEKVNAQAEK